MIAAHPMADGAPPAWADTWGEDLYGVWAGFVVGEVEHRLRFIPGGTFTIGSPPGELGRGEDEEQREAEVRDFWLGETPVTQALYHAVTGTNPSQFQSSAVPWLCADRPVEQVSFLDAEAFLKRLNRDRRGLDLGLPSEEAWEYACRASTYGATYAGELEAKGLVSATLDGIAWYAGNSDREFDLTGFELADSTRAERGTHRVGRLAPNPLGLNDMLGNVWEWTATTEGSLQVLRGGAWDEPPQLCRAASRQRQSPEASEHSIGFRLAREAER